jgi:hypothetical protein
MDRSFSTIDSPEKKRKLGQRFRPEYCIEFSCLMKSTQEPYAYCKYCKQDLSIQHGGRDEHTYTTKQLKSAKLISFICDN